MGKATTAREYLSRRVGSLKTEKDRWVPDWKEISTYFCPRRGKFLYTDSRKPDNVKVINSTGFNASRSLGSGLMSSISSPAQPFFRLAHPDPSLSAFGPVREWLDEAERLMYKIFAASNLYTALPAIYEEVGTFGTAAMLVEEDYDTVIRCTPFTIGEYMLDVDSKNRVNTFARVFQMQTHQMVDEFGLENVSQPVKDAHENDEHNKSFTVTHLIEPVENSKGHNCLKVSGEFKWVSVHFESGSGSEEEEKFLRVRGYHEFPVMAPRWSAKAGDVYGTGCGFYAVGDARSIQVQEVEYGKAVALKTSPAYVAPSEMKNKKINRQPGAVNFSNSPVPTLRALHDVRTELNHIKDSIKESEARIKQTFYENLFLMHSQQDDVRTATEIHARNSESLLQIGPPGGSIQVDLLSPFIDRVFGIMMRHSIPGWKGEGPIMLPPPPPELADTVLDVQYISALDIAQMGTATGSMGQFMDYTARLAELDPSVLDRVNFDENLLEMARILGMKSKTIRGEDEANEIREAAAKAQQAAEIGNSMGEVVKGVEGLSRSSTEEGNVLSDVLGVGQGQPGQQIGQQQA